MTDRDWAAMSDPERNPHRDSGANLIHATSRRPMTRDSAAPARTGAAPRKFEAKDGAEYSRGANAIRARPINWLGTKKHTGAARAKISPA